MTTILGLVRNLSIVDAAIVIGLVAYAQAIALPATFALAAALGAKALASKGVLLTRLSALHEAATIDVLCADKKGTLTRNELGIAAVRPMLDGWSATDLLAVAALASSPDGGDPIDTAIRRAARANPSTRPLPVLLQFTPFDPASKRAEATARDADGRVIRIAKGAPAATAALVPFGDAAETALRTLADAGNRTLTVALRAAGTNGARGLCGAERPAAGRFRGSARGARIPGPCSATDIALISALAIWGVLMRPLPAGVVLGLFGATVSLVLALDQVKVALSRRWRVDEHAIPRRFEKAPGRLSRSTKTQRRYRDVTSGIRGSARRCRRRR